METVDSVNEKYGFSALDRLSGVMADKGFSDYPDQLLLLAFKKERQLEVYGRNANTSPWTLIKAYPFTAFSGQLGPKLQEGDRQIPEGIYKIKYLNPNSSYHLSARINYPNQWDRDRAAKDNRTNLGGDIFIHGKNVTIGCIPIGDEPIEEVFLLLSKVLPKEIKVIIAPVDFRKGKPYPKIQNISWERELYDLLQEELSSLNILQYD